MNEDLKVKLFEHCQRVFQELKSSDIAQHSHIDILDVNSLILNLEKKYHPALHDPLFQQVVDFSDKEMDSLLNVDELADIEQIIARKHFTQDTFGTLMLVKMANARADLANVLLNKFEKQLVMRTCEKSAQPNESYRVIDTHADTEDSHNNRPRV